MKFINFYSLFFFISFLLINSQIFSADKPESVFINDSIINKSNANITVQVQFSKSSNVDLYSQSNRGFASMDQEKVKKYAAQPQITQSIKYTLEPNKEIKFYEDFIKSNPVKDNEYWMPTDLDISSEKGFILNLDVTRNQVGDELLKSKKYNVSILNNGIKVETENTLK